ncbi:MAG: hypothetical protein FWC50_08945 [Planctomycetaceae bacterium]|nr:hypothetical protein [Planctomycetaceae bacterium]
MQLPGKASAIQGLMSKENHGNNDSRTTGNEKTAIGQDQNRGLLLFVFMVARTVVECDSFFVSITLDAKCYHEIYFHDPHVPVYDIGWRICDVDDEAVVVLCCGRFSARLSYPFPDFS